MRPRSSGHAVWVAARDPERGRFAADALGARFVELDVTGDASVCAAAERVAGETGLEVLVNNAGIVAARAPAEQTTAAHVREGYETNVLGIVPVPSAFAPL